MKNSRTKKLNQKRLIDVSGLDLRLESCIRLRNKHISLTIKLPHIHNQEHPILRINPKTYVFNSEKSSHWIENSFKTLV